MDLAFMNTFSQAVDYVNNNQETWNRMISLCHDEWAFDLTDGSTFEDYVFNVYGIEMHPLGYNQFNYHVIDSKKYLLFQIKFS